jgi:hypothetical protein
MKMYQGTSFRIALCITTAVLCLPLFLSRPALGGEVPSRLFASLTADERNRLPDNTMVKLQTGRIASLGDLRAEHQARLARFANASGLGQMAATELAQPAVTGPIPKKEGKSLVPSHIVRGSGHPTPTDYLDFCNAAKASACLYLPARQTMLYLGGIPQSGTTTWVEDFDPLFNDGSFCRHSGGVPAFPAKDGCFFWYPGNSTTTFKATGSLSTKASCGPPGEYKVDRHGTIEAAFAFSSSSSELFTTGKKTVTCVVRVWTSD